MVMRCWFNSFYKLYTSNWGKWFHNCLINNRRYRRLESRQSLEHSHTDTEFIDIENLRIKIIPTSRTNYSYLIYDEHTNTLGAVDPGDALHILDVAKESFNLPISIILLTHKHWDHSGGVETVLKHFPDCKVYANPLENLEFTTHPIEHENTIFLGDI